MKRIVPIEHRQLSVELAERLIGQYPQIKHGIVLAVRAIRNKSGRGQAAVICEWLLETVRRRRNHLQMSQDQLWFFPYRKAGLRGSIPAPSAAPLAAAHITKR